MKKYEVSLFQPYLRRFVHNFGHHLKHFRFSHIAKPLKTSMGYHTLPSYEKEIKRNKITWITWVRRIVGIPNVRVRFDRQGDLFFTYACLILTNKPYCTYIETGVALYNYDLGIARNPIARTIVTFLATRSSCKRLIFLSEAAKKSFFASVWYPAWARKRLEAKSIVIYPIPIAKQSVSPKKWNKKLKLLFPGTFYMKGGLELAHAYQNLRKTYSNVELTIVTALHTVQKKDIRYLKSLPGVTLLDAKLSEQEMIEVYRTHDVFVLPTYRDGFGLVLIEALAYGMPVIITDQYATSEMAEEGYNGFIYKNHPLQDYDSTTYKMLGHYSNPKDFYAELLKLQRLGKLKPVEQFLEASIKNFLDEPKLLEEFSRHSLDLYKKKFDADMLGEKLDRVFLEAIKKDS